MCNKNILNQFCEIIYDNNRGVISMNAVPSIEFLTDRHTILYFAVLTSQVISVYSNSEKGKNHFAIANIVFILIFSYLYLSKYYMLK